MAVNLEILDASQSQLTQNEQVKNMIDKGCDVVCVNLVDRTEPTTITDLAENKFLCSGIYSNSVNKKGCC